MDPQIIEKKPGICPICKMELTKIIIDSNSTKNELKLSEEQIALANIKTSKVSEEKIGSEKILNGQLVLNENRRYKISSRVSGRIEHLYVKNTGEFVKPGTLLYEIYSEEFMSAEKEYLMAVEKQKRLSDSGIHYNELVEGAKNKLLLWGLNENQINALVENKNSFTNLIPIYSKSSGVVISVGFKEGDYLMNGDGVYEIANLNSLWVEAQLYANEVSTLSNGDEAFIKVDGFFGRTWKSKIVFASPQLEIQSTIDLIRGEISNSSMELKPGMRASILLKEETRKAIVVPLNAVLQDSKGAVVWIKKENGSYESRMVIIGIQSDDKIEIRSGIEVGEEVVISGAYLLNSEYIFKRGTSPMY